jgi:AcrR family transcriptional regulator
MSTTGTPSAPRRRPTRTQAERRATSERRLLRVTAELIAQRGTSAVSFGDIAQAAGCSHGLPSYLFGTKAGLLHALLNDVIRAFRTDALEPAVRGAHGLEALLIALRVFFESLDRSWPQTRAVYVLQGEALGSSGELQARLADYNATLRTMIAGWIAEGIAAGDVRPTVRPDAESVILLGAVRGIGLQYVTDPFAFDLGKLTVQVLDSVTRSLAVDPEAWHTSGTL